MDERQQKQGRRKLRRAVLEAMTDERLGDTLPFKANMIDPIQRDRMIETILDKELGREQRFR